MIDETSFGIVKVDGETYDHDIVILSKKIIRRKKEITKQQYGTSHKFSKEEMKAYLDMVNKEEIDYIVFGTGQYGKLTLLPETVQLLEENNIEYIDIKTPDLVKMENDFGPRERLIIIIHTTC